jgi:hypothetical protein
MKNSIYFLAALLITSCSNESSKETASATTEGYTKDIEYAVDAAGMFHEDLTDDDFSDISKVMTALIDDVLSGKLEAYDIETWQALTEAQVREKLIHTDTLYSENPETGALDTQLVPRDYTKQFHSIKFRESWKYSPEGALIERKVIALAPRIPVYSSVGGDLRGYTSAFWVKVK